MSRALIIIQSQADRNKAATWAQKAPYGARIEFREAKRTNEQNDKLWACLTDVAQQVAHHGVRLSPDDWKLVFMDALTREMRMVPNLNGDGFVNLGRSSSKLSKSEMSDLIEIIHEFGARHGVIFNEPKELAA